MANLELFEREFNLIRNKDIRQFTEFALSKVPAYFWVAPSSSTGKYHPPQSNGEGGLVRHTKAAVYFADILCRAFEIENKDRDIVLSASILHDCLKYGMMLSRYTTKTHDKDGADFVLAVGKQYIQEVSPSDFAKDDLMSICKAIAYHMGSFTTPSRAKKFPEEFTKSEIIVHLADMISAGKEVHLNFLQESLIG